MDKFTFSDLFLFLDNSILRFAGSISDHISVSLQLQKILTPQSPFTILIGPCSVLEYLGAGDDLKFILENLQPRQFKTKEISRDNLLEELERLEKECLLLFQLKQGNLLKKISDSRGKILNASVKTAMTIWEVELQDDSFSKFSRFIAWDRATRPVKFDYDCLSALKWTEHLVKLAIELSHNGNHLPLAGVADTLLRTKKRRKELHDLNPENPAEHINYQNQSFDPFKDLCDLEFIDFSLCGFCYEGANRSMIILKDPVRNSHAQTMARLQALNWLLKHMQSKVGQNLMIEASLLFDFDIRKKILNSSSPILLPLS